MNKLFILVLISTIFALPEVNEDKKVNNKQQCVQEVNLVIPVNEGRRIECQNIVNEGCLSYLLYPADFPNTNQCIEAQRYDHDGKLIINYDCGREGPISYFRARAKEAGWRCSDVIIDNFGSIDSNN